MWHIVAYFIGIKRTLFSIMVLAPIRNVTHDEFFSEAVVIGHVYPLAESISSDTLTTSHITHCYWKNCLFLLCHP